MSTLTSHLVTAGLFSLRDFGGQELLIVLVIILIIFGPTRLPQLSRAIGKSIRDFKRGLNDIKEDIDNADVESPSPPSQTPPAAQPDSAPASKETKREG